MKKLAMFLAVPLVMFGIGGAMFRPMPTLGGGGCCGGSPAVIAPVSSIGSQTT